MRRGPPAQAIGRTAKGTQPFGEATAKFAEATQPTGGATQKFADATEISPKLHSRSVKPPGNTEATEKLGQATQKAPEATQKITETTQVSRRSVESTSFEDDFGDFLGSFLFRG